MRVIFDTNVIADILLRRAPYFDDSYLAILNCLENGDWCSMPVSATADIFYLLRKTDDPKDGMRYLRNLFDIISDVTTADYDDALSMDMEDFEDALIAAVAKRNRVDYIITRNVADFKKSPVSAITPDEFLRIISKRNMN